MIDVSTFCTTSFQVKFLYYLLILQSYQQGVEDFLKPERVSDVNCKGCKKKTTQNISTKIQTYPQFFIITNNKVNEEIECQPIIDIEGVSYFLSFILTLLPYYLCLIKPTLMQTKLYMYL